MNELPLTERSDAGTYYVITRSRTIYQISLDPDQQPQIVRYPAGGNMALHDGEPLTGVGAFRFDAVTGEGTIFWCKERPEEWENPEAPYVGSRRRTSLVKLILHDTSGRASIAPAAPPSERPKVLIQRILDEDAGSLLDKIRLELAGGDDDNALAMRQTS